LAQSVAWTVAISTQHRNSVSFSLRIRIYFVTFNIVCSTKIEIFYLFFLKNKTVIYAPLNIKYKNHFHFIRTFPLIMLFRTFTLNAVAQILFHLRVKHIQIRLDSSLIVWAATWAFGQQHHTKERNVPAFFSCATTT
jgi:hypothetical protein